MYAALLQLTLAAAGVHQRPGAVLFRGPILDATTCQGGPEHLPHL